MKHDATLEKIATTYTRGRLVDTGLVYRVNLTGPGGVGPVLPIAEVTVVVRHRRPYTGLRVVRMNAATGAVIGVSA